MQQSIGFIGLGHMGQPMAWHLLHAGYPLRIYDLDSTKGAALVEAGAMLVGSPGEVVEPGGLVLSMVPNDQALEAIVTGEGGLLERIGVGGVHVSLSTISPDLASRMAAIYDAKGSHFVAATVSGRPDVAKAAQLSILYSGRVSAKERILPLLRVLGNSERLYDLGEYQEAAAGGKLAVNHLIVAIILALADSAALAERCGVPRALLLRIVRESPLFAGSVFAYGDMIAADEYTPALFPVSLGEKDVRLMLEAAAAVGMGLPAAKRFKRCLHQAAEAGWVTEDWAVAARVIAAEAGLVVRQAAAKEDVAVTPPHFITA